MITNKDDLVITKWGARYRGRHLPCAIGRGGIGVKTGEGDGITPAGTFRILGLGVRPDRVAISSIIPQFEIGPMDKWSDDPKDPAYNHLIRAHDHAFSHERLRRADPLYDAFVILDFNYPEAQPGKGSAIFLHIWRRPRYPTEGCVAFEAADFLDILSTWTADAQIHIRE
ncbi:MAG: L,D-transpeptidase family protein [Pseudomonadota bacterium]